MTTRSLFTALLACGILAMTATHAVDPDMWWHLRTADYILQNGIPTTDVFSHTVAGREWITHEWLSQLLMGALFRVGGFNALILFFSLLIAAALGLTWRASRGRPFVAGFLILLAALTSQVSWGTRPQMFNFFFLALFLLILESYRRHPTARFVWLLVPLTALWANLHSGFILGVVVIATYALGDWLQRRLHPNDERVLLPRQSVVLAGVAGLALLASILNPNGVKLWLYPFATLGSGVIQTQLVEWISPDFHDPAVWPFLIQIGLGVLLFIFAPRRPTLTDLLLFAGTAFGGLLTIRHIPLFALTATPILARYSVALLEQSPWRGLVAPNAPVARLPRPFALLNVVIALAACLLPMARLAERMAINPTLIELSYPAQAVAFVKAQGWQDEPMFNSFNWGGYLIWSDLPVYIDGRADVYGDRFFTEDYRAVTRPQANWQAVLDRHAIAYVLIEADQPLATLLAVSPAWREAYRDNLAVVFVRQ